MADFFYNLVISVLLLVIGSVNSEWTYDSNIRAPEDNIRSADWNANYEVCRKERQSPIDLVPGDVEKKTVLPFEFNHFSTKQANSTWKLKNPGYCVQLDLRPDNEQYVRNGGLRSDYKTWQFHFHWGSDDTKGSEHTVDGRTFPMEVHIVHYESKYPTPLDALADPSGIAVLGTFYEISAEDNPDMDNIISKLVDIKYRGTSTKVDEFELEKFLPTNTDTFYRYEGSLTTPTCAEAVIWTVFEDTIKISSSQMQKFRELFWETSDVGDQATPMYDNYRVPQPLNGRTVTLLAGDPNASSASRIYWKSGLVITLIFLVMFGY